MRKIEISITITLLLLLIGGPVSASTHPVKMEAHTTDSTKEPFPIAQGRVQFNQVALLEEEAPLEEIFIEDDIVTEEVWSHEEEEWIESEWSTPVVKMEEWEEVIQDEVLEEEFAGGEDFLAHEMDEETYDQQTQKGDPIEREEVNGIPLYTEEELIEVIRSRYYDVLTDYDSVQVFAISDTVSQLEFYQNAPAGTHINLVGLFQVNHKDLATSQLNQLTGLFE